MITWISVSVSIITLLLGIIKFIYWRKGKKEAAQEIALKEAEKSNEILKNQRDIKPIHSHADIIDRMQKRKDNSK